MSKVVYDYLKQAGTYYLATVEGKQPRVRPFGTIDLYEGKLLILTNKGKKVAKQIEINPKLELSAMVGDTWIRVQANAYINENIEAQRHILEAYPSLAASYQAGNPNTGLYELRDGIAAIYSFTGEAQVIKF